MLSFLNFLVLAFFHFVPRFTTAAQFTMCQFTSQAAFLIVIVAVSMATGWSDDDVKTARFSQAYNSVFSMITFYFGWKLLPASPASHELGPGQSLLWQGFSQNWRTITRMRQHYRQSLLAYYLALIFAESAANAFTVVAVVFLDDHVGMTGSEIGIFFLVTIAFMIPGSHLGCKITHFLDPSRSWQLAMACLIVVTIGGSAILDQLSKEFSFVWAGCLGLLFGWFYPTEGLFFSMILPKGQDAEFSGLFVYCTQILTWAPPLLFTGLVELDVTQTYGVWSVCIFFVIAIVLIRSVAAPTWAAILEDSQKVILVVENEEKLESDEKILDA